MNLTTPKRIFKLGLVNFWRNRWLSLAATLIMTLTLLTMSVFVVLNFILKTTTDKVKDRVDVTINFRDQAKESEIKEVQTALLSRSDIKSVKYISKEEALRRFQANPAIKENIRKLITTEDNPLPRGLQIQSYKLENLESIAQFINQPRFKELIYSFDWEENRDLIKKLDRLTNFVEKGGIVLTLIFVVVSALVIFNTVRIAVISRKDEIEIMRLVGASANFIRAPFLLEGALYVILATILSTLVLFVLSKFLDPFFVRYLGDTDLAASTFFIKYIWIVLGLQLGVGLFISLGTTLFSLRRHIKI